MTSPGISSVLLLPQTNMHEVNRTTVTEFILVRLSENPAMKCYLFILFLLIYIITVLGNMSIIFAYKLSSNLQTPMYFFLANFSLLEVCYVTDTSPKMLSVLLSDGKSISLYGSATQLFGGLLLGGAECYILTSMAYDRYNAICHPLLYNRIMNKMTCSLLLLGSYLMGVLSAVTHTTLTFSLPFCGSNINHFFCDVPPLLKLAGTDTWVNELVIFALGRYHVTSSVLFIVISYIYIIVCIFKIRSSVGSKKAFSTYTSHLIVVTIFYGSIFFVYLKPKSKYNLEHDRVVSVMYTTVAPLLNPFIYSIRNTEMKLALLKMPKKLTVRPSPKWLLAVMYITVHA
ncbi:PREDICTED: olfactory receptor 1019-like [Nanorana parkeri]|uniref:olfactory receptor 1019-like n=1 Tax=Nanorana parkeri TaxID=125878 RepID=UPI000854D718|nr:PREDICTED: olfactory receptor 1019-like [Nanorana parkeri]